MQATLQFLGAARSVTGSSYLLQVKGKRLLIDAGLYQERELRTRNWDPFPVEPSSVDAILLTHAHADHAGLLPRLVRAGFAGPIYCTDPTADIAGIMLMDAARIQAEDLLHKQKRHEREGREGPFPLEPLYTIEDVERTMGLMVPVVEESPLDLGSGVSATYHVAGHILGAAMIRVTLTQGAESRSVLFSGDVGRWDTPILQDPSCFEQADYVVCESTYGDRLHEAPATVPDKLARIINETRTAGGKLIVPTFAVERTQEILYQLSGLLAAGRIPSLPVFLDSPMAIRVTEVFKRHEALFDAETRALIRSGRHPCDFPGLQMTRTADESKTINDMPGTVIVMAGSGMCEGGRIKHHLVNNITRPECTVLFVGYQAVGTLGRVILERPETVRILGRPYPVKARIAKINGFSGHADRDELLRWLGSLKSPPRQLFLTHGDSRVCDAFASTIQNHLKWPVTVPSYLDTVPID